MAATATRERRLLEVVLEAASTTAPPSRERASRSAVYDRLSRAIRRYDKAEARRIYYDEILPDRSFSRGEVLRLSYRLGVIDEGDQYLASCPDL
jgi:hypothetical protein